jgi:hypothetical protein
MTADDFRKAVTWDANDIYFTYKGKNCGFESEFDESFEKYLIWYGDKDKEYGNFEDALTDKFFDGKSIAEIINTVEVRYS